MVCWRGLAIAFVIVLGSTSCSLLPWPFAEEPEPAPPQAEAPSLQVKALPAYRLVVDAKLEDRPSRLIILHARVRSRGNDFLHVDPVNARVILPDGSKGRIFDRTRAAALMDHTEVALWNLAYVSRREHPPGGISPEFRSKLRAKIREHLMDEVDIGPGERVKGYLVVDTMYPLESLENVSLEIIATRNGDGERIRGTYQFAVKNVMRGSQ